MRSTFLSVMTVALALFGLGPVTSKAAAVVSSGFDPTATLKGAVSYRNFQTGGGAGNNSVRLGTDLSVDSSYSEFNLVGAWLQGSSVNKVKFNYNSGTGVISATVDNGTLRGPFNYTTGNLGALNYVQIHVRTSGMSRMITLANVKVNGENVGSYTAPVLQEWNVKGINLTGGFTIEGDLSLTGSHGGGDSTNVEITVGHVAPADNEGPVTTDVFVTPQPVPLNGPATVTATVSDATTGGNTIASAAYELNGGSPNPMSAADSAFDEVTEDVTATISVASQIGVNTVCVYGTDSLGNTGGDECQNFVVDYVFHGFLSPINMGEAVTNKAKAGQAVPAKWRLTDYNGVPIADASSFVALYSYDVNCSDFVGDPIESVTETASGSSDLQYLGDGYWQFNWKTPKSYEGTCRKMYVGFNSTTSSPHVRFSFQKK